MNVEKQPGRLIYRLPKYLIVYYFTRRSNRSCCSEEQVDASPRMAAESPCYSLLLSVHLRPLRSSPLAASTPSSAKRAFSLALFVSPAVSGGTCIDADCVYLAVHRYYRSTPLQLRFIAG